MNAIGNKIRILREVRGYSQEYMADRMGISQTAYSRMESEATELTLTRLEQVANVLEMNPMDIISMDEKFVFNNCTAENSPNSQVAYQVNHNGLPDSERKQLEDKIGLLEDKITLLEELLVAYRGNKAN